MRRWGRGRRWIGRTGLALAVLATLTVMMTTAWVGRAVADRSTDRSASIRPELAALHRALDEGTAERMQAEFPEGYVFMNVLYGLAWTDLAAAGHADSREAQLEAGRAVEHLRSPAGTAPFSASLSPPHGVFHAGWLLLLEAQLAALEPEGSANRRQMATDAETVAQAFAVSLFGGRSPFLEAYPGQSWPVDSVVAVAALRTADRVSGADHAALIDRWLTRAGQLVDPATGLLPHRTDPASGRASEGPRATSQSIIQRFWPTVDPAGAARSYGRFRELFVTSKLGGVGVREYLPGVEGPGDVDSGPLVLGLSASASAVTIGAARAQGDQGLATALTQEAEVLGTRIGGQRRYLFGRAPAADAFLAWARATPVAPAAPQPDLVVWWPVLLVLPWLAVLAMWWLVLALLRRRRRRRRARAEEAGEPDGPESTDEAAVIGDGDDEDDYDDEDDDGVDRWARYEHGALDPLRP
jgi:hypothetical protein